MDSLSYIPYPYKLSSALHEAVYNLLIVKICLVTDIYILIECAPVVVLNCIEIVARIGFFPFSVEINSRIDSCKGIPDFKL